MKTKRKPPKAPELPHYDFAVLRDLRKHARLTIEDVSTRSGISTAVISKLERNQSVAELDTMFRLARVFGMNAADLIALAESRTAHIKEGSHHEGGSFSFDEVDYANVRLLRGFASAGGAVSRPEIHRDDFEVCWVLRGHLRIRLPSEQHDLRSGQAVQFDAILPHSYEAVTDVEVIILHLAKPKRF
jgi:transcriptional regulator with XRE-family HTH domain